MFQSSRPTRLLQILGAAVLAMALMAPMAMAKTPAPGFERFAGCPSSDENPAIKACVRSVITGGNFKMGSKNVPISKPITLSGGTDINLENFAANSKGGMTPVKQLVPGGVIGWTGLDWLVNFLSIEALQLYAVTEPAGQPKLGFNSVTLPIKVHLVNPVLGNNCYVGSFTNPIVLNLTTETTSPPPPNKPITGIPPEFSEGPNGELIFKNGEFVDNSFSAPGASGCTLTLFGFIPVSINGLVNLQAGLPAAAGTNEARQDFELEIAESSLVYP